MGNFIKDVKRRFASKKLEFKLKHGIVRRGRVPESGGLKMGGNKVGFAGTLRTKLIARHLRKNAEGNFEEVGRREVLNKKVTTAFVNFIVAQLQTESSIFGDFKYHDSGTGVGAESAGDTALGTPCAEARDSGTQEEGAETYEYKSIATHTYAGGFAITEHGLFNASTGVTLMDRTVFAVINVISGDKIEFTFTIQFSAEA